MNDQELRRYLDLSEEEFSFLSPSRRDAYRDLAAVSDSLEQLPSRYNRPPETDEDDVVHAALEALSVEAFARLEALIKAHEDFRRVRADAPQGRPRGRRRGGRGVTRDPLCDDRSCVTDSLQLAAKISRLGR